MYISDRWLMHSKNDYKYMYLNIFKVKLNERKNMPLDNATRVIPLWMCYFFLHHIFPLLVSKVNDQSNFNFKISKVLAYGCSCRKMKQPGTCSFTWYRWSFQYLDKTADSACSPISEAMLIWGGQIKSSFWKIIVSLSAKW